MKRIIGINFVAGLWLVVAPFALKAQGNLSVWEANDIVLGLLLIASSWWILAAVAPQVGLIWFEMLIGLWLIVAPFILGL